MLLQKGFSYSETYLEVYGDHLKFQEALGVVRRECQTTLQVSEEDVRQHGLGNNVNNNKTECFAECMFSKLEMFNSTNGWNIDISTEKFGVAMLAKDDKLKVVREKVTKCAYQKLETENACSWANRSFECFRNEGLSLG